jgi:hypothetical protein
VSSGARNPGGPLVTMFLLSIITVAYASFQRLITKGLGKKQSEFANWLFLYRQIICKAGTARPRLVRYGLSVASSCLSRQQPLMSQHSTDSATIT